MPSDVALLEQYVRTRDAEAFAELVRRYAGCVYGVSRRITGNAHDAEDVAQECFMDLARGAGAVRISLGGWLHTVATRRSLDALRGEARRRRRERAVAAGHVASAEPTWAELAPHVDRALEELPERLRVPVIMRYTQGLGQQEIATALGVNQSTVSRRLEKGVQVLRGKLRKAGVAVPAALLAGLLAENAASAAPAALTATLGKMAMAGVGKGTAVATGMTLGTKVAVTAALAAAALGGVVAYAVAQKDELGPAAVAQPAQVEAAQEQALSDFSGNDLIWKFTQMLGLVYEIPPTVNAAMEAAGPDDPIWGEPDAAGSLNCTVKADKAIEGPVVLAFFTDPSSEGGPVQLRKVDGPGNATVGKLPAGEYWIGALAGDTARPDVLGVHGTWPQPITVAEGQAPADVDVLLSAELAKQVNERNAWLEQRLPEPGAAIPDGAVYGYVYDSDGRPVKHAYVIVRQRPLLRDDFSLRESQVATDATGLYVCRDVKHPYDITNVWWEEALPEQFGMRHHSIYYRSPKLREKPGQWDFSFARAQEGDGEVEGRLLDQEGNFAKRFIVFAIPPSVSTATEPGRFDGCSIMMAVASVDGSFSVGGLPEGSGWLGCNAADSNAPGKQVQIAEGQVARAELVLGPELRRRTAFFRAIDALTGEPLESGTVAVWHGKVEDHRKGMLWAYWQNEAAARVRVDEQVWEAITEGAEGLYVGAHGYKPARIEKLEEADSPEGAVTVKLEPLPLYQAAEGRDVAKVKALLGADPECPRSLDFFGTSALHVAAYLGDKEIVKVLLDAGAEIDAKDGDGRAALFQAAYWRHLPVVELLVERGADVKIAGKIYWTPMHAAARWGRTDMVKLFLEKGAHVDCTDKWEVTPLTYAAREGHVETMAFLLDQGADVNARTKGRNTPLHSAAGNGQKEAVGLLLRRGANVAASNDSGTTPYDAAVEAGQNEVADLLTSLAGTLSIHGAASVGNLDAVKEFLKKEPAAINSQDESQRTPLHCAASGGHLEVVQLLMDSGADLNALDEEGRTALQLAAQKGHEVVAELLRRQGGIE